MFIRGSAEYTWTNIDVPVELPRNTLLLVQTTHTYTVTASNNDQLHSSRFQKSKNSVERQRRSVIWVLDAAVLGGDDVSGLHHELRIQAARKFCMAVNKSNGDGTAELVCAESWDLRTMVECMGQFEVEKYRAEEMALAPLPESAGASRWVACRGVRFVELFKGSARGFATLLPRLTFA